MDSLFKNITLKRKGREECLEKYTYMQKQITLIAFTLERRFVKQSNL